MPSRRLPNSNSERSNALNRPTERVNQIPPPAEIPYTATTLSKLSLLQNAYQSNVAAAAAALRGQTDITAVVNETRAQAGYFIADLLDAMQRAVRRGAFNASVRAYYQLPVGESKIPRMRTESEVLEWGTKAIQGETERLAAGGVAITFPDLSEVEEAFNAFKNANLQQAERKTAYENAQQAIANSNDEVDKLILKLWNETETFFDEGDKPTMRRKAREWGVVYVPSNGETPSPADFSLIGKVTKLDGTPLADVTLMLALSNLAIETSTDASGNYYYGVLTPGTYQLLATKDGFDDATQADIGIEADQLVELNITMQPTASEPDVGPATEPDGEP